MKLFFTLLISFLFTFSGLSQAHKKEITKHAETYYEHLGNQNFDGILDYMYPKVFDIAPREQMKIGMQQMFNAPDMKIEFISNDITTITDEKEVDGITYAAIFYSSKMRMTFLTEEGQSEEDQNGFLGFMKATLESQFGAGNVTADPETMSLIISNDANMFAINDPVYKDWKFIGNDDAMKSLVNSIIPETIRTELLKKPE